MSNWITPEEMERIRKRKKIILYISFPILIVIISATITILTNNI